MKLNKTARTNLMYIGIVILALMLIPLLKKIKTDSEEYSYKTARSRRRGRRKPIRESRSSKARRKAKTCKYLSSPRARKKMGC